MKHQILALAATLSISLVACSHASVPARSKSAAPKGSDGACPNGGVPAGRDGACVKTCDEDADCADGRPCVPTQFEQNGEMAHVRVCG